MFRTIYIYIHMCVFVLLFYVVEEYQVCSGCMMLNGWHICMAHDGETNVCTSSRLWLTSCAYTYYVFGSLLGGKTTGGWFVPNLFLSIYILPCVTYMCLFCFVLYMVCHRRCVTATFKTKVPTQHIPKWNNYELSVRYNMGTNLSLHSAPLPQSHANCVFVEVGQLLQSDVYKDILPKQKLQ